MPSKDAMEDVLQVLDHDQHLPLDFHLSLRHRLDRVQVVCLNNGMQLVEKTSDKLLELFDQSLEQTLHFVHTGLEHAGAMQSLVMVFTLAGVQRIDLHLFLYLNMP